MPTHRPQRNQVGPRRDHRRVEPGPRLLVPPARLVARQRHWASPRRLPLAPNRQLPFPVRQLGVPARQPVRAPLPRRRPVPLPRRRRRLPLPRRDPLTLIYRSTTRQGRLNDRRTERERKRRPRPRPPQEHLAPRALRRRDVDDAPRAARAATPPRGGSRRRDGQRVLDAGARGERCARRSERGSGRGCGRRGGRGGEECEECAGVQGAVHEEGVRGARHLRASPSHSLAGSTGCTC